MGIVGCRKTGKSSADDNDYRFFANKKIAKRRTR